jgi:hypothetical protein
MSGALLLDLSPRVTDGHYPGKAVSMLVHMVFKVARTMAPSVVYIDEVEKVFVSDKKRAREFGGTVSVFGGSSRMHALLHIHTRQPQTWCAVEHLHMLWTLHHLAVHGILQQ